MSNNNDVDKNNNNNNNIIRVITIIILIITIIVVVLMLIIIVVVVVVVIIIIIITTTTTTRLVPSYNYSTAEGREAPACLLCLLLHNVCIKLSFRFLHVTNYWHFYTIIPPPPPMLRKANHLLSRVLSISTELSSQEELSHHPKELLKRGKSSLKKRCIEGDVLFWDYSKHLV